MNTTAKDQNSDSNNIESLKVLTNDKNSVVKQSLEYAKDLNKTYTELKAAYKELENSYLDTIMRLSLAAEFRDKYTGDHIARISNYSIFIAKKMNLPDKNIQNIFFAAPMHDIGKIGIPDSILLKKGKLNNEEFEIIKTHSAIGARLLSNSDSEILKLAESIALTHHERWIGNGYPYGISGDEVPLEGRIIALADVFDALISQRPYKKPFSIETACNIIKDERGKHFEPALVDLFFENYKHIKQMLQEL